VGQSGEKKTLELRKLRKLEAEETSNINIKKNMVPGTRKNSKNNTKERKEHEGK